MLEKEVERSFPYRTGSWCARLRRPRRLSAFVHDTTNSAKYSASETFIVKLLAQSDIESLVIELLPLNDRDCRSSRAIGRRAEEKASGI